MLFSSPIFFGFFLIYLMAHALVPATRRMALIIVGSTIFYSYWYPFYTWVPFLQIFIAFGGALWVNGAEAAKLRAMRTGLVAALLLLPLAFFKYTNFIAQDVIAPFFGASVPPIDMPLPLGISFVTFTMIAYVVDIHRRQFPVVRSLATVTGYTLYFPQLIAGPILRPKQLIPQLEHPRKWMDGKFILGVAVFSIGLFKKLVIADPLASVVDAVYASTDVLSGWDYILALYGFSAQIYCDFSGYTDMAIGSAMILGVRLPTNFRRPYSAIDLREFWRRWHITLSNWLRDYLYIPLGGSRRGGRARAAVNIIITMALGGLWHGASWNFVIWGIAHGLGISTLHLLKKPTEPSARPPRWRRGLGIFLTFHFVTATWVFFRAPDIATAWRLLSGPFVSGYEGTLAFATTNAFPLLMLAIFLLTHSFDRISHIWFFRKRAHAIVLWSVIALLWVLAIVVSTGSSAKFIYFDF